jgi:hypothetical protein
MHCVWGIARRAAGDPPSRPSNTDVWWDTAHVIPAFAGIRELEFAT